MPSWKWLYNTPYSWRFVRNVIVKAALLFAVLNLLFMLADPLPTLGRLSAYNVLFKGRARLPYGENSSASYNLSLYQLDAMFASQALAGADHAGEFRVLLIGDSSVWGILLQPEDTLAAQINAGHTLTADGRRVRAYNLGYPTMSLTKDLLLLDYGLRYHPDLIVWLFTLESFGQKSQLDSAIVQNNPDPVQRLIKTYDLAQSVDDPRFVVSTWRDRTILGQRRALADLLRLQFYGVAWSVTGIDQEYRADYTPRAIDLAADESWHGLSRDSFTPDDLAFDVLHAGIARAGNVPVLLINEPMFISEGQNSDIRYNFFFPRWLYDEYRRLLTAQVADHDWRFLDLWDRLPDAACYTDSAVHLTPACSAQLGQMVGAAIVEETGRTAGSSGEDALPE